MRPAIHGKVSSDAEAARTALLAQMLHLADETEAMQPFAVRLSQSVLELGLAPGELSIKELYGILAQWDADVLLPLVRRMIAEDLPCHEEAVSAAGSWQAVPIPDILRRVREARIALVSFVQSLPPAAWARQAELWGRCYDIYGLLHLATQHTASVLQTVAQRLGGRF